MSTTAGHTIAGVGINMSKKARTCLILHKKSAARPEVREAVDHCSALGHDLQVLIPWRGRDRRAFIDRAIKDGCERIIAGGGDGTLNKVVNALLRKKRKTPVSLGLLPLGTANDFAFGAGLPKDDLKACLEIAITGEATPIDVGRVNGRHFINVASGGFGAEITATTPQDFKKALGGAAYTLMGMAKAFSLKPHNAIFTADDGVSVETTMIAMAVGNNRFAGGGFEVAPKADMRDGLLDFSILTAATDLSPTAFAAELKNPFDENNRLLRYRQSRTLLVEADRPLHLNLDGEPVVDTRFTFDVLKHGLPVVLGPSHS